MVLNRYFTKIITNVLLFLCILIFKTRSSKVSYIYDEIISILQKLEIYQKLYLR
jgi:hypothetical protein